MAAYHVSIVARAFSTKTNHFQAAEYGGFRRKTFAGNFSSSFFQYQYV
jgi:hypothetical protein